MGLVQSWVGWLRGRGGATQADASERAAGGGLASSLLGSRAALAAICVLLVTLLLPVPPGVLDLLLLANLLLAGAILGLAVQAGEPQRLPQLPALLVVSILLRLGLNVAAVRLILTQGYAGRVIDTFGSVVVRGDYLVGAVIFVILATVQYLVLARGGERVAEVAARFVLDALPGRQAAIEADLRALSISFAQAQERRAALDREAQVYGAMDGALRLVKGDVVAGLLVLGLGLGAGLFVGVVSQELSLGEAASRYALLTIGDGLVTQVPVLLTATAASLLLTRGVQQKAVVSVSAAAPPPLVVSADPALGLTAAALQATLDELAAELGVPVPAAVLRQDETLPPRALRVRLLGAALIGQTVAADEAPLPALKLALGAAASELLTLDDVQRLLDELQRQRPALLREVVPRRLELPRLTALLRRLLDERVWPLDLRAVLETVAALPKVAAELPELVEQVRAGLGRFLVHGYVRAAARPEPGASANPEGLPALLLDVEIEDLVRESLRSGRAGADEAPLLIEPELQREIVQSVLAAKAQSPGAVVLCHGDVRRHVQRLLWSSPQALPVLAYNELPPSLPVLVMGRIEPGQV
jgi:flagellar biosynthesis component FlhA